MSSRSRSRASACNAPSIGSGFLPSEKPARRLRDIIENAAAIERYVVGLDMVGLGDDVKTRDAIERCLERISEAAAKLGDEASELVPGQPWPEIRALGNRLRHEYDRVRVDRLWTIIVQDLPSLRTACEAGLAKLEGGG